MQLLQRLVSTTKNLGRNLAKHAIFNKIEYKGHGHETRSAPNAWLVPTKWPLPLGQQCTRNSVPSDDCYSDSCFTSQLASLPVHSHKGDIHSTKNPVCNSVYCMHK